MKYQLHLSTGMEVPQIELWFQNRRTTDGGSGAPAEGATLHCSCQSAQQWLWEQWPSGLQVQGQQQLVDWKLSQNKCAAEFSSVLLGNNIRAAASAAMMA